MNAPKIATALWTGLLLLVTHLATAAEEARTVASVNLNIESQPLGNALNEFGQQSGLQVVFFFSDISPTLTSPRLAGKYSPQVALEQLLANTPLAYKFINARTVAIVAKSERPPQNTDVLDSASGVGEGLRLAEVSNKQSRVAARSSAEAPADMPESADRAAVSSQSATPEILVKGSRILNMDATRTRDDVQPYVVFSAEDIRNSQAGTVDEFLKTRLPMNARRGSMNQEQNNIGNRSEFNLRGLGANQTLVLVDGKRMPGFLDADPTGFSQPDVNGIPIAAIERIEVLPSTASGIYGGGATGGVINIILRKDYTGLDMRLTYGNTFDSDAAERRVDASAGFNLEGGRTQLLVTASHSDANPLLGSERNFHARSRALALKNAPELFYGSPFLVPFGYTTNIVGVDPNTFEATNLTLKSGPDLNSPYTFVPIGYTGVDSDDGAGLVNNAGQYNLDPPDTPWGRQSVWLNTPTIESASFNVRRSFGSRVQGYVDFIGSRNEGVSYVNTDYPIYMLDSSAPNNPFTTPIMVNVPLTRLSVPSTYESRMLRGSAGVIISLPGNWSAVADYTRNRARNAGRGSGLALLDGFAADVQAGTADALNVIRDLNQQPLDYTGYLLPSYGIVLGPYVTVLNDATVRAAGPVWQLPAGPLVLSALTEYRNEKAFTAFADAVFSGGGSAVFFTPGRSQHVDSYYLETQVPVISARNATTWARSLDLQMSARHDRYRTRGVADITPANVSLTSRNDPLPDVPYLTTETNATRYSLGIRYMPLVDIALRASVGTGFLPPSITQITPQLPDLNRIITIADPKRDNVPRATGPLTFISGGNPGLEPEDSKSISAGVVFTPRFLPQLRLSVDYTRIRKEDEIGSISSQDMVNLEDAFPGRVERGTNLPGDPVGWPGPIIRLDRSLINVANTRVEAYDFQVDYTLQTSAYGQFQFYTVATRQTEFERRTLPTSVPLNSVGFNNGPLKWRGNAGMNWSRGSWSLGLNAQYYDSYFVYSYTFTSDQQAAAADFQGSPTIPSQVYVDAFAKYQFDNPSIARGWLANTEIGIGIQNLLDKQPPVIADLTGFTNSYSLHGDPRLRRFSISLQKNFN